MGPSYEQFPYIWTMVIYACLQKPVALTISQLLAFLHGNKKTHHVLNKNYCHYIPVITGTEIKQTNYGKKIYSNIYTLYNEKNARFEQTAT